MLENSHDWHNHSCHGNCTGMNQSVSVVPTMLTLWRRQSEHGVGRMHFWLSAFNSYITPIYTHRDNADLLISRNSMCTAAGATSPNSIKNRNCTFLIDSYTLSSPRSECPYKADLPKFSICSIPRGFPVLLATSFWPWKEKQNSNTRQQHLCGKQELGRVDSPK